MNTVTAPAKIDLQEILPRKKYQVVYDPDNFAIAVFVHDPSHAAPNNNDARAQFMREYCSEFGHYQIYNNYQDIKWAL